MENKHVISDISDLDATQLDELLESILKLIAAILSVLLNVVLVYAYWHWFVSAIVGRPDINLAQAFGLVGFVRIVTGIFPSPKDDNEWLYIISRIVWGLCLLLVGWLAHFLA